MRPVKTRHFLQLVLLSALWGASFLFMRVGAAEFGALPAAGMRVAVAAIFLMPLLLSRGQFGALRQHFDTTQIVELTSAIATYNMVARFLVALGVSPET